MSSRARSSSYWKDAGRLNKNPQRSAGFVVLKAPDVPSVLLELGYLSSQKIWQAVSPRVAREGGRAHGRGDRRVFSHNRQRARRGDRSSPPANRVATARAVRPRRIGGLRGAARTVGGATERALRSTTKEPHHSQTMRESASRNSAGLRADRDLGATGVRRCMPTRAIRSARKGFRSMRLIARFLGFLFATGAILFVVGAAAAGAS